MSRNPCNGHAGRESRPDCISSFQVRNRVSSNDLTRVWGYGGLVSPDDRRRDGTEHRGLIGHNHICSSLNSSSLLAQIPPTPSFPATSFSSLPHELIIYIAEMVLETTSIISLLRLNQHFLSLLQPLAHRSSLLCDDPVSSIKYTPMTHLIWIAIRPPLHPFIKDLTIWIEDPDLLPTIATLLLRLPALHTLDVECSSEETVRLEYFWPIVRQVKTLVKLSLVTEMTLTAELNIAVDLPLLRSLATECPQYFPGKRNITHLDWTIRTPLQNVDRSLNKFDSLKSLTFKGRYGNEMPLPNFSRWTVSSSFITEAKLLILIIHCPLSDSWSTHDTEIVRRECFREESRSGGTCLTKRTLALCLFQPLIVEDCQSQKLFLAGKQPQVDPRQISLPLAWL